MDTTSFNLGGVTAKLDALEKLVRDNVEENRDHQRHILEELGAMALRDQRQDIRLQALEARMDQAEPVIADVRKMRTVALAGFAVGSALVGVVTWVWQHIPWAPRP